MSLIRVIVIDDSAFMRKVITGILESNDRIQVIATARNGKDGIQKVKKHHPDVVTLDVQMPIMDGMTALETIMSEHPIPVVLLSGNTKESTTETVKAISNGAVDFIKKPAENHSLHTMKEEVIRKVIAASQAKIKKAMMKNEIATTSIKLKSVKNQYEQTIVAIGTSTGGPRALQRVLSQLPNELPAPILIVQHIPSGFTKSLADRLNSLMSFTVKEATENEVIQNDTVYIAPGDYHLKAKNRRNELVINLSKEAPICGHRPSVDKLFYSIADMKKINKIAVVLTGMGRDGAEGIRKLKSNDPNSVVIAESEETATIYGMPKAAVNTNCVDHEVPLTQVGKTITNIMKKAGGK